VSYSVIGNITKLANVTLPLDNLPIFQVTSEKLEVSLELSALELT
jgi:hypothetical protein